MGIPTIYTAYSIPPNITNSMCLKADRLGMTWERSLDRASTPDDMRLARG